MKPGADIENPRGEEQRRQMFGAQKDSPLNHAGLGKKSGPGVKSATATGGGPQTAATP